MALDKTTELFATTNKNETMASVKAKIKKANTIANTKITKTKVKKTSAKAKTTSATIKFKKVSDAVSYEVQCSTSKKFTKAKTLTTKKTSYTVKKLKKGKKYYVRVRGYVTNNGKNYYGAWSKVKTIHTENKKRRAVHEYVSCPFRKMQEFICRTVCRNPGCTHRSFSCSNHLAADEGFHQSAGSAPVRVHAGSESDRRHPGLLQDAECCHLVDTVKDIL